MSHQLARLRRVYRNGQRKNKFSVEVVLDNSKCLPRISTETGLDHQDVLVSQQAIVLKIQDLHIEEAALNSDLFGSGITKSGLLSIGELDIGVIRTGRFLGERSDCKNQQQEKQRHRFPHDNSPVG